MSGSLEVPLQILLRNVPHSDALDAEIRRRAAKLETFHPRLSSCRVTVERLGAHQRQGPEFRVRIDVRAPGMWRSRCAMRSTRWTARSRISPASSVVR
jgi:hypothetical protein